MMYAGPGRRRARSTWQSDLGLSRWISVIAALWLTAAGAWQSTAAEYKRTQQPVDEDDSSYLDHLNWNLPTPTLGGKQLWTDHLIHGQWRIQQHAVTSHWRLLDPRNVRRAWGSWEDCLERWQQLRAELDVPALKMRVVILLHGLGRTRSSMKGLANYLGQQGDYSVLNFSYASTRAEVSEHAKALDDVISHLQGVQRIDFVAHSLGNLVIRHYMADQLDQEGGQVDPRIGRIVMVGPPNCGARLAERVGKNAAFRLIFGASGQQLAERWDRLQSHLVVPPCQFGIIAGGDAAGDGRNPLLQGNDDFIVEVAETKLPGARDFIVVKGLHSFLMDHSQVHRYTATFLEHGYFVSPQQRQPIPSETGKQEPGS